MLCLSHQNVNFMRAGILLIIITAISQSLSHCLTNEQEPNKYLLTGSKNIALRRNLMRNSEIFKYPQSFKICNGHFWSSPQDLLLSSPNLTALDFPTMWFGTSVHALGIGFNWYKPYILFTSQCDLFENRSMILAMPIRASKSKF